MKTIDAFVKDIAADDALKAEMAEAAKNGTLIDFFASHDVTVTEEELATYAKTKLAESGELSEEQLEAVAGGVNWIEATLSVCTLGLYCAATAITSAASGKVGEGPNGQLLCDQLDYEGGDGKPGVLY